MRRETARTALAAAAVLAAAAAPAQALAPYTAVYRLEKNGLTLASLTRRLEVAGDRWRLEQRAEPRGLATWWVDAHIEESSEFTLDADGRPRPLRYRLHHSDAERAAKDDLALDFDHGAGRLCRRRGHGPVECQPLEGRVYDPLTLQLALRLDAAAGAEELHYRVADEDGIDERRFQVAPDGALPCPKRPCATVLVSGERGSRRTAWWLGVELDHLPLRIRQWRRDRLRAELSLETVERPAPPPAEAGGSVSDGAPPASAGAVR